MGKPEGKIAVITGGSSGTGLATAKRFVKEGAPVVITGQRENELKDAAASIAGNVTTVVGDVSRLEDLDRSTPTWRIPAATSTICSQTQAPGRSHHSRRRPRRISTRPST